MSAPGRSLTCTDSGAAAGSFPGVQHGERGLEELGKAMDTLISPRDKGSQACSEATTFAVRGREKSHQDVLCKA